MDICQIGYDICEFDSLRGLGIDIIGRVHFDNRDKFAIWMGSIGMATEPCQQTSGCWHLTYDSFLNLDMGDDTNTKFLLLRVQTTYMRNERTWGTWLIMLGFMDLGWPRVCRRSASVLLTHWGRVTHICVSKLTTVGSDNSLSPGRRQTIIWTNAGILLIQTLGINFSEILR